MPVYVLRYWVILRYIYLYLGWLEVFRTHLASLGEFGKLPATLGASNPGLTEPASMFVIELTDIKQASCNISHLVS